MSGSSSCSRRSRKVLKSRHTITGTKDNMVPCNWNSCQKRRLLWIQRKYTDPRIALLQVVAHPPTKPTCRLRLRLEKTIKLAMIHLSLLSASLPSVTRIAPSTVCARSHSCSSTLGQTSALLRIHHICWAWWNKPKPWSVSPTKPLPGSLNLLRVAQFSFTVLLDVVVQVLSAL